MFSEKEFLAAIADNQLIIHKICNLYTDTKADRQDLFQEILLNAWQGVQQFRGDAKFSTWLYRVALNTAITYLKKDRRYTQMSSAAAIVPEAAELPEEENEQVEAMNKAIFGLSNIDKAIVSLYLDDYPYQEISEIMGISVNHVAVKMNRIKARLKETGKRYMK